MTIYTYTGKVFDRTTRAGIAALRVEAWDTELEVGSLVGCALTGTDGDFSMSLTEEDLKHLFFSERNPTAYFRILSGLDVLASTEGRIHWMIRGLAQQGRFLVDAASPIGTEPAFAPFVVLGRVVHADTGPLDSMTLWFDDINVGRADQRLSAVATSTGPGGTFRFEYPASAIQQAGKALPDLRITVEDRGVPVLESVVRCKTPPTAWFDLVVGGTEYVQPAFLDLQTRLVAALGSVLPATVTDPADLEHLACSTGATLPEVAAYVAAHKLGDEMDADPQALFGLMREGLPLDKHGLLRVQRDFVGSALAAARQSNIISTAAASPARLATLLDRLKTANVAAALTTPPAEGTTCNLGDVLTLAGLEPEQQEVYLERHLDHPRQVPLADFWIDLATATGEGFSPAVVANMQQVFQWGSLTRYHLPLMYLLKALKDELAAVTLRDLARYNEADWETFLGQANTSPRGTGSVDFPADTPGANTTERRKNYAWTLTRTMELAFPTAAIGSKERRANSGMHTDLSRFIENNPTFEFGKTRARVFLQTSPDLTDVGDEEALKTRLFEIERLSRLTLQYEHIQALSSAGFTSARSVVQKGRAQFLAEHGDTFGAGEAALIFDKAVKLSDAATFLTLKYSPAIQGPQINALPDLVTISGSTDPSIADWSTLFGSLDHCTCKHCMSVFGPGAYLVDLLQWLGQFNETAKKTLIDGIAPVLPRRPDIKRIGLTCENTDTALPYIDLVNEILEHRIADFVPAPPIETKSTTPELKATPEVIDTGVHAGAYAALYHATYPFSLPFHFWNEEARVYLDHLGVPRHLLMERLQHGAAPPEPSDLQIAQEYLGLSTPERAIIVDSGATGIGYWGMTSLDWSADLLRVETFLNRSQLTFDELVELVDTALLESHAAVAQLPHIEADSALEGADGCKLEDLVLAGLDETTLPAAWGEVHRFLRLRRRLEWSIRDLDRAKTALAAGLDDAFILHLDGVVRLTRSLKVAVVEALSWWGPLDTRESPSQPHKPSFYDTLFQNKALQNPVDPAFQADALTGTLADAGNAVLAGTRLSSADYWLLTDAGAALQELALPVVVASDANLDVANLSLLFRHGSLARALKLSVADLRTMIALTGEAPLTGATTATPADTRAFVARIDKLRTAGLKPAEVHYLIRHIERPGAGVASASDVHATWLAELQAGHDAIAEQNEYVEDPTGKTLETLLADLIGTSPALPDPMDSMQGARDVMRIVRRYELDPKPKEGEPPTHWSESEELDVLSTRLAFLPAADLAQVTDALIGNLGEEPEEAPLDEEEPNVVERIRIVQEILLSFRSKRSAETLVVQIVAGKLGLTGSVTERLLRDWMSGGAGALLLDLMPDVVIDGAPTAEAMIALARLAKAATVISRLRLSLDELAYVHEHLTATHLTMDDLAGERAAPAMPGDDLPAAQSLYAKLERLFDFAAARKRLRAGPDALVTLLAAHLELDPTGPADLEPYFDLVATLTDYNRADLAALVTHFEYDDDTAFAETFKSEEPFLRVAAAFDIIRRLGTSALEALTWLDVDDPVPSPPLSLPDVALDKVIAVPTAAKRLASAKHGAAAWPEIAQKLRDPFRERQRDALVAQQLHQLEEGDVFPDVADLYGEILVDPEMAACQLTSRIKQATGSIQQFIQRIFLNLEDGLSLGPEAAKQWKWMRTYRVWEAARKVLLYPENWVLPELRDGKSQPFQQLESQLRQGELNESTIEKAYRRYLDGLNEVARLDVISTFPERKFPRGRGPRSETIHVLARTIGDPNRSFYRTRNRHGEWSAWRPTDLELPSDNCVLYVASGRTFIAWPRLQEKPVEGQPTDTSQPAQMYYTVDLISSELRDGSWLRPVIAPSRATVATDPMKTEEGHRQLPEERILLLPELLSLDSVRALLLVQTIQEPQWLDTPSNQIPLPQYHALARYVAGECGNNLSHSGSSVSGSATTPYPKVASHAHPRWGQERETTSADHPLEVMLPPQIWMLGTTGLQLDALLYTLLGTTPADYDPSYPDPFTIVATRAFQVIDGNKKRLAPRSFFYRDRGHQLFVQVLHKPPPKKWTEPEAAGPGGAITAHLAPLFELQDTAPPPHAVDLDTRKWASVTAQTSLNAPPAAFEWEYRFLFTPFDHNHVCAFLEALFKKGPSGLAEYPDSNALQERSRDDFEDLYDPAPLVAKPYPKDDVDFSWGGAYSLYNWELFFHVPFLIAQRLHADGRFEQAHEWLRAIFDPTSSGPTPSPQRFWKVKPFREIAHLAAEQEEAMSPSASSSFETIVLAALLQPASTWSNTDPDWIVALTEVGQTFDAQLEAWREQPFNPHLVARMRPVAYMKATVMLYIENLLAWGDQLFRRDTIESINEATQLYSLAKQVLGRRPIRFNHPKHEGQVWTYETLSAAADDLENAENVAATPATDEAAAETAEAQLAADEQEQPVPLLATTAFCLPPNDDLIRFWDTVDDRLFKIHHCMNIEGIVRELPLFEPPIDPALLVQAAAAGVDLSSVLNDIQGGLPKRRFKPLWNRAVEIARDAASFGASLLSNLEKSDGEHLARLSAVHESELLQSIIAQRKAEIAEARESVRALEAQRPIIEARRNYYEEQRKLKIKPDEEQVFVLGEQAMKKQDGADDDSKWAAVMAQIPDFVAGASGLSSPVVTAMLGGSLLSANFQFSATEKAGRSRRLLHQAQEVGQRAGYERRFEEWGLQLDLATAELRQLARQIIATSVRVAIAEKALESHELQIEQSKSRLEFLKTKFTREELYADWLKDQLAVVFYEVYKIAYDAAKLAERAYRFERAEPSTTFITFGYWDAGKKGLLAGERLLVDLRKMDAAFESGVRRDYEIEKTVSLAELFPEKLLELRRTGKTEIALDESLFDQDHPGQFMRRLFSVGISIPTLAGPHAAINCKLTLLNNKLRSKTGLLSGAYEEAAVSEENRFLYDFIPLEAICTSTASGDIGMFAESAGEAEVLPFQGAGAISKWRIELLPDHNAFDLRDAADVVLSVRYRAREGGAVQAAAANETWLPAERRVERLFSLREELPSEWESFVTELVGNDHVMELPFDDGQFPFLPGHGTRKVLRVRVEVRWGPTVRQYTAPGASPLPEDIPPIIAVEIDNADASKTGTFTATENLVGVWVDPPPEPEEALTGAIDGDPWKLKIEQSVIASLDEQYVELVAQGPDVYRLRPGVLEDIWLVVETEREPWPWPPAPPEE